MRDQINGPVLFDICDGAVGVSECFGNGNASNGVFAAFSNGGGGGELFAQSAVVDGRLAIRTELQQQTTDHIGQDMFVFADWSIHAIADPQILQAFGADTIPTVVLIVNDHGVVGHGPTQRPPDGGPVNIQSGWSYSRTLNVDYFSPVSGFAIVSYASPIPQSAGSTAVSTDPPDIRFENSVPTFLPTVANFQLGLHMVMQLSGDTFGNGNVDMNFRNTTSIDGIRVFTPDGTDVTSGMHFFLDDGTPLFTAAVGTPEPGTLGLLGLGIAGMLIAARRRLRG